MRRKNTCLLFFLFACSGISAQVMGQPDSIGVQFVFEYNGLPITLGEPIQTVDDSDVLQIDRLRFYVANVQWDEDAYSALHPEKQYQLVDAAIPSSLKLRIPAEKKMQLLHLQLGVDSLTNDAGVHGGDLDPSMGMYWAWQTGYINFKLEGSNKTCDAFTYHLGGFLDGNDASVTFQIPVLEKSQKTGSVSSDLDLVFELQSFLEAASRITNCKIMRPSKEAVLLSEEVQNHLSLRW